MELHPVPLHAYATLIPLVPDAPGTLLAHALLRDANADTVVVANDPAHPTAAVIAQHAEGSDARAVTFAGALDDATLAAYLRTLPPPAMLYTPTALAARLTDLLGVHARLSACPFVTFAPPADSGMGAVFLASPPGGMRRLRVADARSLTAIPTAFWGAYGTAAVALGEGIAYARYLRAEIVALACVTARTERYAEIGTFTVERARGNDFARDCAARLIGAVAGEWGLSPLLTGAADDEETRAAAHALGLTEEHAWTAYAWA